jgi:hypothetical protein
VSISSQAPRCEHLLTSTCYFLSFVSQNIPHIPTCDHLMRTPQAGHKIWKHGTLLGGQNLGPVSVATLLRGTNLRPISRAPKACLVSHILNRILRFPNPDLVSNLFDCTSCILHVLILHSGHNTSKDVPHQKNSRPNFAGLPITRQESFCSR